MYVELLAYDGSPSIICTFHDETGQGTIAAETFNGVGTGRLALHRVRSPIHFRDAMIKQQRTFPTIAHPPKFPGATDLADQRTA